MPKTVPKKVAKNAQKLPPLAPPGGGGPPSHCFDGFWPPGPKRCPRGLQGEPRGAQSHPKCQLLVILGRFLVDFDVIFTTFGCSRECPGHKMNTKIWAAFSLRLKSARVPKFGQHSPSAPATKVNIKIWTAFRPAFQKCQGANRYLTLPEYHA